MSAYTCYSDTDSGCGSFHRLLSKAEACCKVHATKHDESRTPVRIKSSEDMVNFPASAAAAARRDAWLATRKDTRLKYDPTQGTGKASGGEPKDGPKATAETGAEEMAQIQAAVEAATGSPAPAPDAAPAPAGESKSKDDKPDPLQPLADLLCPLMAEGIAETVTPILERVASELKLNVDDSELKSAKEKANTAARRIQLKADAIDENLKRVDEAIEKINDTKKVEITVTSPELKQTKIEGAQHEHFELLLRLVGAGENVFMSGPAGSGKTTAATKVAEALGMDLIVQPVAMDKFEATGFIDAGGTFRESAVYKWAKATKPSILLIDEIDAWMPQALVAMNPILDNRLGIFPGGQQFDISPLHRVIATANTWGTGADAEYVGRNRLDAASLDRFGARLDWGYDEKFELTLMRSMFSEHKVGVEAAAVSQTIRKNLKQHGIKIVWGPRQTIGLARRIAAGLAVEAALDVSALAALAKTNRERVLTGVDLSGLKTAAATVATA